MRVGVEKSTSDGKIMVGEGFQLRPDDNHQPTM